MYVYLDTSQLFEISKLSGTIDDKNGLSLQNFFQIWNNTNAELCLSFVHLKEISQLDDSDSRLRRISLLKKSNSINFSIDVIRKKSSASHLYLYNLWISDFFLWSHFSFPFIPRIKYIPSYIQTKGSNRWIWIDNSDYPGLLANISFIKVS